MYEMDGLIADHRLLNWIHKLLSIESCGEKEQSTDQEAVPPLNESRANTSIRIVNLFMCFVFRLNGGRVSRRLAQARIPTVLGCCRRLADRLQANCVVV